MLNAQDGDDKSTCWVMNTWAGAAGDRSFSTSARQKTWGDHLAGKDEDGNILILVR